MRLSNAKINHLARLLSQKLHHTEGITCLREKNDLRLRIKIIFTDELRLEEDVDRFARRTITSMTKTPPEGSKEWEVLYQQYYEGEMRRRRGSKADGIRRMG